MNIFNTLHSDITQVRQKTAYFTGNNLLDNLDRINGLKLRSFTGFLLLTDKQVFSIYGNKVIQSLDKMGKRIIVSQIEEGETSKNFSNILPLVKPFFQKGFDRRFCLITLGGGVTTDLGGLIGSIVLRGIPVIHLPTSLLAQVDAAIGGKSGVDMWLDNNTMVKNMIGKIEQPIAVVSDVNTLNTLPEKEILNGLGEIFKYWVGWGKPSIEQLLMINKSTKQELAELILISQKIKIDIVQKDPFDTLGIREKLNLGHTIGHAIEGTAKGKISHGKAVVLGIVAVAKISLLKGLLTEISYKKIIGGINKLEFSKKVKGLKIDNILKLMKLDKKGGNFVLIKDIGNLITGCKVEKNIVKKVLQEIIT